MNRLHTILEMLKASPDDLFLHYAVAIELMAGGEDQAAIDKLNEIKSISPNYLPIYYQLGQLYEKVDRDDQAIDAYRMGYEKAVEQNETKTAAELKSALEELQF